MKTLVRAVLFCASLPLLATADNLLMGGGLNFSTTDASGDGIDHRARTGFNVGLGYEKQLSPTFFYVPGINIETRGETMEGQTFFGRTEATLKMLYLQIPVMAMVKVPMPPGSVQFFAGPSLGFNLASKAELSIDGDSETQDLKDQTNGVDFGLEFGMGLEIPFREGTFFIRPAYYIGLSEALDSGEKLRNFKIQIGLGFPLSTSEAP